MVILFFAIAVGRVFGFGLGWGATARVGLGWIHYRHGNTLLLLYTAISKGAPVVFFAPSKLKTRSRS